MGMLPHERLQVFWIADEYVSWLDRDILPRIGAVSKRDFGQIDGSAGSLIYNIIEAAADKPPLDKARFFRYARREVNESFGVIWRNYRRGIITEEELQKARDYVDQISRILWTLIKTWEGR
jgi:four helix bundle protein